MLFYHKGLGVRKAPLPLVAGARKAAILQGQIWSAHESDVVGVIDHEVMLRLIRQIMILAIALARERDGTKRDQHVIDD